MISITILVPCTSSYVDIQQGLQNGDNMAISTISATILATYHVTHDKLKICFVFISRDQIQEPQPQNTDSCERVHS